MTIYGVTAVLIIVRLQDCVLNFNKHGMQVSCLFRLCITCLSSA